MIELWDRLGRVRTSRLRVEDGGTTREGPGTVILHRADPSVIEWEERGSWRDATRQETAYHDRLRWKLDAAAGVLSLYHLRQGEPVHLADLEEDGEGHFRPPRPHLCADDLYIVDVRTSDTAITMGWKVTGPKKSYQIERVYR